MEDPTRFEHLNRFNTAVLASASAPTRKRPTGGFFRSIAITDGCSRTQRNKTRFAQKTPHKPRFGVGRGACGSVAASAPLLFHSHSFCDPKLLSLQARQAFFAPVGSRRKRGASESDSSLLPAMCAANHQDTITHGQPRWQPRMLWLRLATMVTNSCTNDTLGWSGPCQPSAID